MFWEGMGVWESYCWSWGYSNPKRWTNGEIHFQGPWAGEYFKDVRGPKPEPQIRWTCHLVLAKQWWPAISKGGMKRKNQWRSISQFSYFLNTPIWVSHLPKGGLREFVVKDWKPSLPDFPSCRREREMPCSHQELADYRNFYQHLVLINVSVCF